MKVNRLISIDLEVAESLKEINNVSKFINDYLIEYLGKGKGIDKIKLKDKIKRTKEEVIVFNELIDVMEKELKTIQMKEEAIKETFKNIPTEILDDFKGFKFTEQSLFVRQSEIYSKKYKFTFSELKKAWLEFNE